MRCPLLANSKLKTLAEKKKKNLNKKHAGKKKKACWADGRDK